MYHVIYYEIIRDSRPARAEFDGFCAAGCVVVEIHALKISIFKIYINFIILFIQQALDDHGSSLDIISSLISIMTV